MILGWNWQRWPPDHQSSPTTTGMRSTRVCLFVYFWVFSFKKPWALVFWPLATPRSFVEGFPIGWDTSFSTLNSPQALKEEGYSLQVVTPVSYVLP